MVQTHFYYRPSLRKSPKHCIRFTSHLHAVDSAHYLMFVEFLLNSVIQPWCCRWMHRRELLELSLTKSLSHIRWGLRGSLAHPPAFDTETAAAESLPPGEWGEFSSLVCTLNHSKLLTSTLPCALKNSPSYALQPHTELNSVPEFLVALRPLYISLLV